MRALPEFPLPVRDPAARTSLRDLLVPFAHATQALIDPSLPVVPGRIFARSLNPAADPRCRKVGVEAKAVANVVIAFVARHCFLSFNMAFQLHSPSLSSCVRMRSSQSGGGI